MRKNPVRKWLALASLLAVVAQLAPAQVVVLNHNNSSASINTSSSAGMFDWTVDGQNLLAQQWFWYRVGLNAEAPINTISAPTITTPDARSLYTSYDNASYSVRVDYRLTGFSAGSGISDIAETITIQNKTAAPLDFHFFQYSDFNLGPPQSEQVAISPNTNPLSPFFGLYNTATQVSPFVSLTETVVTPGANHGEASHFGATLAKLNNGVADNLSDVSGPIGPGNVTWAFQWDFIIPANSSLGISKDKLVHVALIPEPSSLALVGLGVVGLIFRRKNRSR
jgi:hypothetical protein